MDVIVQKIGLFNAQIKSLELVSPDRTELPEFSAGSHIDVHLPNGLIRQYSIANSSHERHRYVIAVLNEPSSRGGSKFIHESIQIGDRLTISHPRNLFPLHLKQKKAILFAGGIGITPILSMAYKLLHLQTPFELHYCLRNRTGLAFEQLLLEKFAPVLHLHFDDEIETRLDITQVLASPDTEHHLYTCGPNGFMSYIIQSAQELGWPAHQIHQEHFVAPTTNVTDEDQAFTLEIKSTGQKIEVTSEQTALQALLEHGFDLPYSCEQGICGTCEISVLAGEICHRDYILSDEEQDLHSRFMPCCSRAKSNILILDL